MAEKKKPASDKKMPPWLKGKYTEEKDKKKDESMAKKAKLTPKEKAEFEKKDEAHGAKKKPRTMQEDKKIDAKIIKGIKAKRTGKK